MVPNADSGDLRHLLHRGEKSVILLFLFVSETGPHSAGLAGLGNDVNQDDLELTGKPLPPKY